MTRLFKNIFLIATLFIGGMLNASCPPNYTTISASATDTFGNIIIYSICYPTVVSTTVNSGNFSIYISIENTGGVLSDGVRLCSFVPNASPQVQLAPGSTVTSNPAPGFTSFTPIPPSICTGTGVGDFGYANGINAGGTARATINLQALSVGTINWQAQGVTQGGIVQNLFPSITVLNVCPTITASNGAGATACSSGSATGNLYNFVTGGASPYTFSTAGNVNGTVSVNNAGLYTFTPNVAGPTTGSFNYQAFDIAGCPSNTGTITLPITPSPVGGNDAFYTTTFGTPVVAALNFTGGTAPFIITTNNIVNGNVSYDSNTAQFTFTQTAPGASFFDYSVIDANGCTLNDTPNIYIYSCNPGFVASANLFNNVIYAICAPATVLVGTTFDITATIVNPNPVGVTPTVFPLDDLVPDPSQGPAFAPGLLYLSNDGVPVGTTFTPIGINFGQGGMGSFAITGGLLPPTTSFSINMNIQATASGPQTYTARVLSNPPFTLGVNINVLPCPTFTAANTGISSCNNEVTGDLSSLVQGVSGLTGPYTFSQTGVATCGDVTVSSTGAFIYTAPIGFTGPCSFSYYATSAEGCASTDGTVTITSNLGPIAIGGNVFICENTTLQGSLGASDGTPPYTFSIVTNGTQGTATITDATLGTFEYIPNPNTFGNDFFTFQVTDSAGCVSNIAQYNVGILEAPNATGVSFTACVNTPVSGNLNSFVSGGNPPYIFTNNGSFGGSVVIAFTGPYTFTPTIGFSGLGGFEYGITDNSLCFATGAVDINISSPIIAPSGISLCTNITSSGTLAPQVTGGSAPYTFSQTGSAVGGIANVFGNGGYIFTPTPGFTGPASFGYQVVDSAGCLSTGALQINYVAPSASAGSASICENNSLIGATLSATGGTSPYTFAIVTNGTLGTATITNTTTGTFNYVPNPDTFGTESFTFQVTDANGCVSNIAAFQITINQLPITSTVSLSGCVNSPVVGNLNDFVSGGVTPYNFTGNGLVSGGSVTIGFTGPFAFAPFIGFTGAAGFEYLVTDNTGCSATGAVDITVLSPIAGATSVNTCLNTPVSGNLASLVASGFPPYVFGLNGVPVGGSATVSSTGIYNFVPTTGYSGPAGFIYSATDTNDCVNTGTVSVTVDSLAAGNGNLQTCNNSVSGILVDYVNGGIGALVFTGPLSSTCGTVTISPNGAFVYNAPTGFTGPCNFVYGVSDSINCSSTGAITIVANTAPVVVDALIIPCANQSYSDTLAGLVQGNPQQPLTFAIVTQPTNGTLSNFNPATGAYTYTPQLGFIGLDSFQYQITDAIGCVSNIGTITVDVVSCCPVSTDPVMLLILQQFWGFSGPTGISQV
jgi:hypothetical protein